MRTCRTVCRLVSLLLCLGSGYSPAVAALSPWALQDSIRQSLSTPYAAVENVLRYTADNNFEPELAGLSFYGPGHTLTQLGVAATDLNEVLQAKGLVLDLNTIPQKPDYLDTITHKQEYALSKLLPGVKLSRVGRAWRFGPEALQAIERMHRELYPFGSTWLLELVPGQARRHILGLELWQYLGIAALGIVSLALYRLFVSIFRRVLRRVLHRKGHPPLDRSYLQPLARPMSVFGVLLLIRLLFPSLLLPVTLTRYLVLGIRVLLPLYGIFIAYRLIDVSGEYFRHRATQSSVLNSQLAPLLRRVLQIMIIILGVLVILSNLQFNVTALLAGLSIGGLAFALAAQDTLKNFFGSIMIFLDKPFNIGDYIILGDMEGNVEEVGLRATRVRTFKNSLVYVPNSKLMDSSIDNMGLRVYRRYRSMLHVSYDATPEQISAFTAGVRELITAHPHTRKDDYDVAFYELGETNLIFILNLFFEVPTWSEEMAARHEINLGILTLAGDLNLKFAQPSQLLQITRPVRPDGSPNVGTVK